MPRKLAALLSGLLLGDSAGAAIEAGLVDAAFAAPNEGIDLQPRLPQIVPHRPAMRADTARIKTVVLVCPNTLSRTRCQPDTALDILIAPEATTFGLCGLQAQAYIANSAIAQHLPKETFLKIVCTRQDIEATIAWPEK